MRKHQISLILVLMLVLATITSCAVKPYQTGISSQTQRVDSKLKRSEYTILDKEFSAQVVNTKKFRKYDVEQLKEAAFMEAEKQAILSGADGVLNPVFIVDQKRKTFFVTARVKAYKIKSDNDYLDMENSLKHNPS